MKKSTICYAAMLTLVLSGCGPGFVLKGNTGNTGATGPQGPAGSNGTNGSNGSNGTNGTSLVANAVAATSAQCPNGGSVISIYQDNTGTGQYVSTDTLESSFVVCDGATGPQGPQEPAAPPPAVTPISSIVSTYNAYRESLGQEDIIPGLDCNLYTVPNTTTAIIGATLTSVGSFEYLGNFNVPNESVTVGMPVLPAALQPLYQTWYVMKCTGYVVMTTPGLTEFDVSSDDGSNLYVDGSLLVSNDGLHSVQMKSGTKDYQAGVHSIELDYLQGGGNQALIVNMNGSLLPSANLFH